MKVLPSQKYGDLMHIKETGMKKELYKCMIRNGNDHEMNRDVSPHDFFQDLVINFPALAPVSSIGFAHFTFHTHFQSQMASYTLTEAFLLRHHANCSLSPSLISQMFQTSIFGFFHHKVDSSETGKNMKKYFYIRT